MSELPKGWVLAKLEEVVQPVMSIDPYVLWGETSICYFDIGSIDNETGVITNPKIMKSVSAPSRARQLVQEGDTIFSTVRPYLKAIAKIPKTENGIASTGFCVIRGKINKDYIYFMMRSDFFISKILPLQRGVSYPAVRDKDILSQEIPIPPLNEQARIVTKLEELLSDLDAGVSELKTAQAKLVQYRQSLLKAAVEGELTRAWRESQRPNAEHETGAQLLERILLERRKRWEAKQLAKFAEQGKQPPKDWKKKYPEPVQPDTADLPELPEGWVWASLSQVGWLDRGISKHRPRNAEFLYGGAYPFIQTGDIRHADTFINNYEKTYSEAGLAQSKLWPTGTMCITIAANIGETALTGMPSCFPDSIVGFLTASDLVSIRYVEYFMRVAKKKLDAEAPATAQKNINLEILSKVVLPLPPLSEQLRIVEKLDELNNRIKSQSSDIEQSLKQSAAQRKNILRAAFAGELVPQDPNDEPASVLLERIQAERAAQTAAKKPRGQKNTPNKNGVCHEN